MSGCFLHKKPQKNCKKCQQALASAPPKEAAAETSTDPLGSSDDKGAVSSKATPEKKDFSFKGSPMLKGAISSSKYYKTLADFTSLGSLINEMIENVDCIDVYNPGDWKITCSDSSKNSPTCFLCHVARLCELFATSPHLENDLDLLMDERRHAFVRCVGFLYLRFVTPFADLIKSLEDYLLDDMELSYSQNGAVVTTTIGEYVESLLMQDKYFGSPLPRLPAKVKTMVEEKVAPMLQYRKRMAANRKAMTRENIEDMPVEVFMDGQWAKGTARRFATRHASRIRVNVVLEGGNDVNVNLGQVIIDEDRARRGDARSRSRSRSRGRGHNRDTSPDWSRSKGKSDQELLRELRDRKSSNAQQAVSSGHTKSFANRWNASTPQPADARRGRRGGGNQNEEDEDDEEGLEQARLDRKRQDEHERQRQLASVYQKYCSSAKPGSSNSTETADTMRFG